MDKERFDWLHSKIRKSVVRIHVSRPNGIVTVCPGTVILTGNNFCYIIAHKQIFLAGAEAKYEVIFADESIVEVNMKDVEMMKIIALFFVFNLSNDNVVEAVKFSEDKVSANDDVYTLSFHQDTVSPSYLAEGSINSVERYQFIHDCAGYRFTAYGSPVFSKDGCFTGISYKDCGAIIAFDIESITQMLWTIHPEIKNKEIEDILVYLKTECEKAEGTP